MATFITTDIQIGRIDTLPVIQIQTENEGQKLHFELGSVLMNSSRSLVKMDLISELRQILPKIRLENQLYDFLTDISSVSIYPPLPREDMEVRIHFNLPDFCAIYPEEACSIKFWDVYAQTWSESGCSTSRQNLTISVTCNHLTSFAVLFQVTFI